MIEVLEASKVLLEMLVDPRVALQEEELELLRGRVRPRDREEW